jgi:hypothetical protein
MKLKCDQHGRRVLTIGDHFVHRTGDMSKCDSKSAVLVDNRSHTTRSYSVLNGELLQFGTNKLY